MATRHSAPPSKLALALLAVLGLGACGDDGAAAGDAAPPDAACAVGQLGCECDTSPEAGASCLLGQCVGDICTLCTRGDEACLCRRDGSCGATLLCEAERCVSCPVGAGRCACGEDGTCEEGFECAEGVCAPSECPPGASGCPCRRRTALSCDEELRCLGDGVCHPCEADRAGCPCSEEGTCAGGLSCDLGVCQTPPTCEDLVDGGFCAPGQVCELGADGVPSCPEESCVAGFVWDDGECVEGRPNCTTGESGSLVEACGTLSRGCVEDAEGARCGDCEGDTTEVDGVCLGPVPCDDERCASFQYCDRSGATSFCADLPCAAGEAKGTDGVCRACGFTCTGEGLSARVFPLRTLTDACVCETLPGWYMPPGGSTTPERCDADGDGWVRAEVVESTIQVDDTLRQNARCDLVEVDGALLRDEAGIAVEVASCEEGLFRDPDPVSCRRRVPMPLVESLRNDTPGPVVGTPAFGADGRRLNGVEVNDLTKFCVDDVADFNDDGVEDLLEVQAQPATLAGASGRARLRSFAHFGELHRAYVQRARAGEAYPKLVIEERFRCDPRDFALRYDPMVDPAAPSDGYRPDDPPVYWRSCQRGVDPGFEPGGAPNPGNDFAQWSCSESECRGILPGPPDDLRDLVSAPLLFGEPLAEGTTLCELGARLPADRRWRGLHHHSQFECVSAGSAGPAGRPLSDFDTGGTGSLVMNACRAVDCAAGDGTCLESRPVSPAGAALEPVIECRALASVDSARVGFAARRYLPYGTLFAPTFDEYRGGCINEDEELAAHMCPGPVFQTDSTIDGFGRDTCFVAPCPLGQADCDGNPFNGCEFEARSLTSCNGCDTICAPANARGDCTTGQCLVLTCNGGWGNCDGDPRNGCEQDLSTLANCSACARPCSSADGSDVSCGDGRCKVISCDDSAGPTGDCNGDATDGCETLLNTNIDCGSCDRVCDPPNAVGECSATGVCEVLACEPGFGDCDGEAANGCEVDIASSTSHCGGCGLACAIDNAVGLCEEAFCGVGSCLVGFDNCDGDPTNGCETNVHADVRNCGSCASRCDYPNAAEECREGSCAITVCDDARSDCNGLLSDGCELSHATSGGACSSFGALDLGAFDGDTSCGFFCPSNGQWDEHDVLRGTHSQWYKVRAVEDSPCSASVEHRLRLKVPPGVDYDLEAHTSCESGTPIHVARRGVGVDESLIIRRSDEGGRDDSFDYWVHVVFVSGASCAPWELIVEGHDC